MNKDWRRHDYGAASLIKNGRMMNTPFFELRNITKYFSQVIANKDVSFPIFRGEVLALLGENGAGKSTAMKILYGLYKADSGDILMNGEKKRIHSPKDAMALGISMIQQHFSLVPAHTVTENIILGNVHGRIDCKAHEQEILELAHQHGFNIIPDKLVRDLAVGMQQKVEILKALYQNTHLLIMDEPTAVLTPQEAEVLMQFVRGFTANGNSVIFITHKLKEVMDVADRIIVMRNGIVSGDLKRAETNERELSRLMIGREIIANDEGNRRQPSKDSDVRLVLDGVSIEEHGQVPKLKGISFSIHRGEIFGVAGVSGNGQQELCEVICGAIKPTSGRIYVDEKDITEKEIRDRIEIGIGYVPSDRHKDGMVMDMTLAENMMLKTSSDKKWQRNGFLDKRELDAYTEAAIKSYDIKAPGPNAVVKGLSGGNQQKVIVAREVNTGTSIIVFDQPTRGLDLGAIDYVHKTILAEREKGKSILLISTELSEIFALADRYTVLYKGETQGIYNRSELTTEEIGLLMAGYGLERSSGNE